MHDIAVIKQNCYKFKNIYVPSPLIDRPCVYVYRIK